MAITASEDVEWLNEYEVDPRDCFCHRRLLYLQSSGLPVIQDSERYNLRICGGS